MASSLAEKVFGFPTPLMKDERGVLNPGQCPKPQEWGCDVAWPIGPHHCSGLLLEVLGPPKEYIEGGYSHFK